MLNYTTADLVVSCQHGDDLLSSSSLQQLLEESRQVISSSRPHSSVVNSSGTTDPLYAHKCQTPQQHHQQQQHHQPTTPTYKVEFHSSHLSSSVSTCFHGVWWRHRCELFSCSSLGVLWWNSFFFFVLQQASETPPKACPRHQPDMWTAWLWLKHRLFFFFSNLKLQYLPKFLINK